MLLRGHVSVIKSFDAGELLFFHKNKGLGCEESDGELPPPAGPKPTVLFGFAAFCLEQHQKLPNWEQGQATFPVDRAVDTVQVDASAGTQFLC